MPRVEVLSARPFRLALNIALAISAATAALFVLIYVQVRSEDERRNASILAYEIHINADASEDALRKALETRLTSNIRRLDYIALFDRDRRQRLGNLTALPDMPIDGRAHLVDLTGISRPDGASQPALVVASTRADGGVLVMGRDLTESNQLERILLRVLATALAPTVVIALVIGALFARRASRRLLTVQDAILRIIDGDMTSRLPISREDDEIDRVALAVNSMLEEIARLLDQFKSVGDNIAHDLRSPLMAARAKIERALEANETNCGPLRAQLTSAIAQLDRAAVTIEALLRISAVEGGDRKKHFGDVDLAQVCADIFEFYEPLAHQKVIAFRLVAGAPVEIRGDRDLVREAVSNLVDNAIKFTPERGEVRIICGKIGGAPFVEVSDTGPGVPASERNKIFGRYYRVRPQTGDGGHGLGLSIAQTIAHLHGFDLSVEDCETGARFVMRAVARPSLALARAKPH